jgi:tetratricopeptide (TPR) repeat protein
MRSVSETAALCVLPAVLAALVLAACAAPPPEGAPSPAPLPEIGEMWDFGDPAATERRFLEVLPAARASGDRAYLAELLSQVARSRGLQQRFDEADRALDEAEALLDDGAARARVLCLLERGRVRNSSRRGEEAIPFFLRAWDEAREAGLAGLAVDAAHMLGIAEAPDAALAWNERAIACAEEATDPAAKGWLGALYNNTGWTLHDRGEHARALVLFEKALAWRRERAQPEEIRVARWCVARCRRSLGRTEEALAEQRALLAEREAGALEPDGFVFEEIGECLRTLGKRDEARPWFGRAHGILAKDPWLSRDEKPRLERLARLAAGAEE